MELTTIKVVNKTLVIIALSCGLLASHSWNRITSEPNSHATTTLQIAYVSQQAKFNRYLFEGNQGKTRFA